MNTANLSAPFYQVTAIGMIAIGYPESSHVWMAKVDLNTLFGYIAPLMQARFFWYPD